MSIHDFEVEKNVILLTGWYISAKMLTAILQFKYDEHIDETTCLYITYSPTMIGYIIRQYSKTCVNEQIIQILMRR